MILRCEVAPPGTYTRAALGCLAVDVGALERAAATELRRGVARALVGVRTASTTRHPDGISRGLAIAACGRQHAWLHGDTIELCPQCCRQRACPSCARARARRNGAEVEAAMRERDAPFVFATLTQPKKPRHEEQPRGAVERIVESWRELSNPNRALGRRFHELFVGGLRTVEVTYSRRGERQRNGGRATQYSGYHAHLHVLLEVREGVDRACAMWALREMWLAVSLGSGAAAQCIRAATVGDAHQLCKYVTKPIESVVGHDAVMRELFAGLHGLRLLQAFGVWIGRGDRQGWREWGGAQEPTAPSAPRWRGPEIGDVLRWTIERLRPQGVTSRIPFERHGETRWVDAETAWTMIERSCAERLRARPPPD